MIKKSLGKSKICGDYIPFIWSRECSEAFQSLKREITNAPVVQPCSLEKEATLTTDAFCDALAAVLTQEGHPVICVTHPL